MKLNLDLDEIDICKKCKIGYPLKEKVDRTKCYPCPACLGYLFGIENPELKEKKSTKKGLVAILMPSFNRPILIDASIDSILKQTYKNWKLYILDNSSPQIRDNLRNHLKEKYKDERIKIFYEDKLIHQGAAYNRLMFTCSDRDEEFVAFAADDVLMNPKKIKLLVNYLNNHPNHHIICGIFGTESYRHGDFNVTNNAASVMNIAQPLMRKKVIDHVGPIGGTVSGAGCPDMWYWTQMSKKNYKFYGAKALGTQEAMDKSKDRTYITNVHRWFNIYRGGGWERGELFE